MPTYPLAQIPIRAFSERLLIVNHQSRNDSPWSGHQTVVHNYAAWTLELTFPRMRLAKAEALSAWLDQLRGGLGTFKYQPTTSVQYANATTTLASTAYPSTTTVMIGGWAANSATSMRVGQYISLGSQLLRIAATPINADSQGRATIEFNPPLRSQFNVGYNVETAYPKGVFRLTDETGSGYQIDADYIPEMPSIKAVEAI